jgi:hypothetical protein
LPDLIQRLRELEQQVEQLRARMDGKQPAVGA